MDGLTYREIWEKARAEGKAGIDDGRPWLALSVVAKLGPEYGDCWSCRYNTPAENATCDKCLFNETDRDFYWPANESLPGEAEGKAGTND